MSDSATPVPIPQPGVDLASAPDWWLTRPKEIRDFLESLDGVKVEEIGTTAGGRAIIAASWGEREDRPGRTSRSFGSAVASRNLSSFHGEGRRTRPHLLFVGAAHGTEFEGTVAALNFLNILATGRDLTGCERPEMAERGRRMHWSVIPLLNVDGRERAPEIRHWIGCDHQYFNMITQGRWANGEIMHYGRDKRYWPIPLDKMDILGTYFNDAGFNLVYDFPLVDDCQPETKALIRHCRREMPDVAICSHSNNGSLIYGPAYTLPPHYRQRVAVIGGAVGMRCHRMGLAKDGIPQMPYTAGCIAHSEGFYQTDLIYQVCGALPLLIEFPMGSQRKPGTHEELLEIGSTVLDEICMFGLRHPFRPYEDGEV